MSRTRRIRSKIFAVLSTLVLLTIGSMPMHAQEGQASQPQRYGPQYGNDFSLILAVPSGKFAESFNLGFGVQGGMFYDIESNVRVGVTIGYMHFGLNQESLNESFHNAGGEGTLSGDGSVSGLPLLIYARLMAPGPGTRMYGDMQGGLYSYWNKLTIVHTALDGTMTTYEPASSFRSEAGVNFGLGVLHPIGKDLFLDLNVRYHMVHDSQYYSYDDYGGDASVTTSQYFSVNVGVTYAYNL